MRTGPMNHTTIHASPASRREGIAMATKRNYRRLAAAAITIAGMTGGVVAAHADTFQQRATTSQDLSQVLPPTWPAIAATPCPGHAGTQGDPCVVSLDAGIDTVSIKDATVMTATVVATVPTITLGSTDHLKVNDTVVLSSADPTWNKSFTVVTVSPDGRTVTLNAASGNPTATATQLPVIIQSVPILGFNVNGQNSGLHTLAGGATSTIKVAFGTWFTINFTHAFTAEPIELSFPSLKASDVTHNAAFTSYTVHATAVGTSVFQPGSNKSAPKEVAMGLVGALIVTPALCANCAYDGTPQYQDEALVATTDLDPEFANNPSAFDMAYFASARNADDTPRKVFHLINGKSFPDTDVIDAKAGENVLLRYVNAGVTDKSMGLLGLSQTLLGRNASRYTDPQTFISPLVGPGETADVIVAVAGAAGQRYSLMDQGRQMNHGTASGFGGALTFLNVWAGVPAAPSVSGIAYSLATGTLSGTATPSAPAFPVNKIEYSVNGGTWTTIPGLVSPITAFSGPVTLTVPSTISVRATDINNNVSATGSVAVTAALPAVGPLAFNLSTGSLSGTASATAGLTVTHVEYSVGPAPTWPGTPATGTTSFNAIVSPGLTGPATLWVRVQDSWGQWSADAHYDVTAAVPAVGPLAFDLSTGSLSGTASATAGLTVTHVEYSVGPASTWPGTPATGTTSFSAVVSPALTAPATLWVRAEDSWGQWSPDAHYDVTAAPPVVSGVTINSDGTVGAVATATAGLTVTGAEFVVNAAPAVSMTGTFGTNPVSDLVGTPATALVSGDSVQVRAQDSFGQWGALTAPVIVP